MLVWIHGGGFFGGCNASPWYRGGPFARDGVVLVSINYRLGAEGFLEVPGAPANRAVRDWVRALEWVQENIAAFGGDPGRVTIAGQSAGGGACAALLGVPAARGLFRGAAFMSGGAAPMQTAEDIRAVAARMPRHLGVPVLDQDALEQMTAETILAAQGPVTAAGPGARTGRQDAEALAALLSSGITLPWAPWADVMSPKPMAAASPRHRDVALLAGATATSSTWPGYRRTGSPRTWRPEGWPRRVSRRRWPPLTSTGGPRPGGAVGQAVTDRTFRVPAQHLATAKAEAGGPAYTYDFRWAPRTGPLAGLAFHCLDVPFFFDALGEPGVAEAACRRRRGAGGGIYGAGSFRHRRRPRLGAARSRPEAGHGVRRAVRSAGRSAGDGRTA